MIKQAWVFLIILGTILGASALFNTMYDVSLTDYSYEGLILYTSPLYNLTNIIWGSLTNLIGNILMPIIDTIQNAIDVLTQLFDSLTNVLVNILNFFGGNQ
jgi:hypothetical protein